MGGAGELAPLLVAMGYVFYGFHVVCDEFFVPALQVMCERLNVPDSVAGATVMAAGASSPEMFTNFISIFAFRSDVGTGTVVGSELFNQLVICGTCAVQCEELSLDWRLLVRELGFYSLSVIWLYLSLCQISRERVTWLEASGFVLMQVVYVIVCIYTPALVASLCPGSGEAAYEALSDSEAAAASPERHSPGRGEVDLERPLLQEVEAPGENGDMSDSSDSSDAEEPPTPGRGVPLAGKQAAAGVTMAQARRESFRRLTRTETEQLRGTAFKDALMDGWVHRMSRSGQFDHRRWLVLEKGKLHYVKSPLTYREGDGSRMVASEARLEAVSVVPDPDDETRFLVMGGEKEARFSVSTPELRDRWVSKILSWKAGWEFRGRSGGEGGGGGHHREEHSLRRWCSSLSYTALAPFESAIRLTVPNMQLHPELYPLTIVMCCVWMAGLSYVMTYSGDRAGQIIGVSSSVVGLTVGAAGTSLPNLFASSIVARKGQGDMAIANAFGSNIFNINIALGLPWLCAALLYHEPWSVAPKQTEGHPIRKSSLAFNTVLLIVFILFFIITILITKLKLNRLTGFIFLASYVLYLAYAIFADYYPQFQPDL